MGGVRITRARQRQIESRQSGCSGGVAAGIFLVVWFGLGTWTSVTDWNTVLHGATALGTVLRAGDCVNDEPMYVGYLDADGYKHQAFSKSCDDTIQPGAHIRLHYMPDDPDRIVTDGDVQGLIEWTVLLVSMYIVVFGLGVFAVRMLRTRSQRNDLGHALERLFP